MTHYAIGKPGKDFRTVSGEASARQNKQIGEVMVEVPTIGLRGKIARDGLTIVPARVDMSEELSKIRIRRLHLLARCDFALMPDSTFSTEEVEAWKAYRTELRDITDTQPDTNFDDIIWPVPPFALD